MHNCHGIGCGLIACVAQHAGRPQANQFVAPRFGAKLHIGVMGVFVFKRVGAVIESGHGLAPWVIELH